MHKLVWLQHKTYRLLQVNHPTYKLLQLNHTTNNFYLQVYHLTYKKYNYKFRQDNGSPKTEL